MMGTKPQSFPLYEIRALERLPTASTFHPPRFQLAAETIHQVRRN